jgi:hypothetical protein
LFVWNKDRILQLIAQLRQLDPAAASAAQRSLDPVIRVAKDRIALIQETEQLMIELDLTGNSQRLNGVALSPQARSTAGLASNQLRNLNMNLIPPGMNQGWVQSVMGRIRMLPVTLPECRDRAMELAAKLGAFGAGVRAAMMSAGAAASSALTLFLEWLAAIGSKLTTPLLFIGPLDGQRQDQAGARL